MCKTSEADKLREELGKTRRNLREVKYLLTINEEELVNEKVKRAQAQKREQRALAKNPEILNKMVALLHKSSKTLNNR